MSTHGARTPIRVSTVAAVPFGRLQLQQVVAGHHTPYNDQMDRFTARAARLMIVMMIVMMMSAHGCAGDRDGDDAAPASDTSVATPDRAPPDSPVPGDKTPQSPDGPLDQFVLQPDKTHNCGSCSKAQICVYFITLQVLKAQCKHRGAQCYSKLVNPCSKCESEVCGLWYTSKAGKCSMPVDGGAFPGFYCYCFTK